MDIFPVDYTSNVGRVRKYIPDVVQLPDPKDPLADPSFMWTDEAIESFILDEGGTLDGRAELAIIFRSAASIMVATANNENLILKKLTTDDLATDGPAVAKALLDSAKELRLRATAVEKTATDEEIFIGVPYPSQDSYRTIWGL